MVDHRDGERAPILQRRLGLFDAEVIALGVMLAVGVFAASAAAWTTS